MNTNEISSVYDINKNSVNEILYQTLNCLTIINNEVETNNNNINLTSTLTLQNTEDLQKINEFDSKKDFLINTWSYYLNKKSLYGSTTYNHTVDEKEITVNIANKMLKIKTITNYQLTIRSETSAYFIANISGITINPETVTLKIKVKNPFSTTNNNRISLYYSMTYISEEEV